MIDVPDRLVERSRRFGLTPSAGQVAQLDAYFSLLSRWNRRINLTALPLASLSLADFDRLFTEPLLLAREVNDAKVWIDLASGGGSPAIPVKVANPHINLRMVEAKARKSAFLREVVRTLSLPFADVIQSRIEDLLKTIAPASIDLLTARALRFDAEISKVCRQLLSHDGELFILGSREAPQPEGFTLLSKEALKTASRAWVYRFRSVSESQCFT